MLKGKFMFAVAAISAAAAFAPSGASATSGGFDGSWTVQITTQRGTCNSSASFGVEIRGGVVSGPSGVRGSVAGNGATRVSVAAGNQSANGSGRLSGNSGVGTQGPCSGRWTASRR
jgi:hypothetical protein